MKFDVKKTNPEAEDGVITLWSYDGQTGRPIPLLRANTYRQMNDSAIKLFGKDAWCEHIKDVFNNEMTIESIFLCADLYQRKLISAVSEWLKDADESVGKGIEEFKKNVSETTKVPEKNVQDVAKVTGKNGESGISKYKMTTMAPVDPDEANVLDDLVYRVKAPDNVTQANQATQPKAQLYESVDGPAHYDGTKCMDEMIALYGREAVRNFCICNAYKYRYRAGRKPGNDAAQDLAKAKWYENYVIENKL